VSDPVADAIESVNAQRDEVERILAGLVKDALERGQTILIKVAPVGGYEYHGDDFDIETERGPMTVHDGDWVLETLDQSQRWPVSAEYLNANYVAMQGPEVHRA
jgi:hypothetical protein